MNDGFEYFSGTGSPILALTSLIDCTLAMNLDAGSFDFELFAPIFMQPISSTGDFDGLCSFG